MRIKNFILSTSILAGTIIGAGVFSLPYLFKSAGLSIGFFYLALAAAVYIAVYFMYADVVSKTKGDHRFVGYTRIHLGENWSWLAILMTIVEMILVLTIYLILAQSFANLITGFGEGIEKMIIFWLLGSTAIFLSLRKIAWLEFLITAGMIGIFIIVFILALTGARFFESIPIAPNWFQVFLPFGAILFALSGRVAIPSMMKLSPSTARKAIVWGTVIPAIVYGLFVVSVLAVSPLVSEDAVSGLTVFVPAEIMIAIGILGILSLLSSYITIGFDIYKSLAFDLRFPRWLQFGLVFFAPLALYFAGLSNFIAMVGIVGGIFLGLEGIFLIIMWLRANKFSILQKPWVAPLLLVFEIAIIYEIISLI
ncbi:MAG: amino acid permease [Candidatus Harrisonbacteria bacterium]|nr:amino acid permease [Candidatus Harrisonbacteria bacterium]